MTTWFFYIASVLLDISFYTKFQLATASGIVKTNSYKKILTKYNTNAHRKKYAGMHEKMTTCP